MSLQQAEDPRGSEGRSVFAGSSPRDVSHARRLWGCVSLLPPLESRLIAADLRQRLPVARSSGSRTSAGPGETCPGKPRAVGVGQGEPDEEQRKRYESMAVRRDEILELLRSQRERRLRREVAGRRGVTNRREQALNPLEPSELEEDRELVQQLQ